MPLRLSHDAYRVGWIYPLEVEQIAALEMRAFHLMNTRTVRYGARIYHMPFNLFREMSAKI